MKSALLGIALAFALSACTPQQHAEGTAKSAMGGAVGAFLDQRNPWHGGVIGATPAVVTGATISDISVRGAREAANALRPVEYRTDDRRAYYFADSLGYEENRRCRKVREKIYEDGLLVRKRVIVFCKKGRFNGPSYRYDSRNDRYELDED